jgi:hypothetical protein
MSNHNGPGPQTRERETYALRVVRLKPGDVLCFRMLSEAYSGLMTHWIAGRGQYCPGPERCPRGTHNRDTIWKGYCAAELWCPVRKLWFPCVPEFTEYCELDLRDRYQRGQVWELRRDKKTDDKQPPIIATLTEFYDPTKLQRAFDVLPIVATMYHVSQIQLGVDNPMPGKVLVNPVEGPPPASKTGNAQIPNDSGAQARKLVDAWRKRDLQTGGGL